jgi:hypothetical protein
VGTSGLKLRDLLRARRQRRQQRRGYDALPEPSVEPEAVREQRLTVRRRVLHLYRLYAVMKAACDGSTVRRLSKAEGPYHLFQQAIEAIEAYEARTQIPVEDRVFVLSVFAHYGRNTWPGMFCHEDVLTHDQRYERRTAHETAPAAGRSNDRLIRQVARAWGLSVNEARRRFGPLLEPQPEG